MATLEVMGPEIGAQQQAHDLTLEGITVTLKASSKDGAPEKITISLGNNPQDHITDRIIEPTRVWLEQTAEGASAALEIESTDEVKTLLRSHR